MTLDELIPQYAANKAEADSYKKLCEKENAQIKDIMKDMDIKDYEAGGYKVSYSVSQRQSLNEEVLLEIAHKYNIPEIVKTKEYIDTDALEKVLYDGSVSEDVMLEMGKAIETKEVCTLRLSRAKEKK